MQISLAKALKLKSRLVGRLAVVQKEVYENNSKVRENWGGEKERIEINQLLQKRKAIVDALIEIKYKLYSANINIQKDLYLLAEKKSEITFLQSMPTTEGIQYGYEGSKVEYIVYISRRQNKEIISVLQKEVDELQDKIDDYNATTKIDISDEINNLL
jgi:hypothetical protein